MKYWFIGALVALSTLFGISQVPAAECTGPNGSIEQMKAQVDKANADGANAAVIELNQTQIDAVISKNGAPPQAELIEKWYMLRTPNLGALALADKDGCILVTVGPLPKQVLFNWMGFENVDG